ncbi:17269_t:CDS:2, partial [Acaulospora morrowiae]
KSTRSRIRMSATLFQRQTVAHVIYMNHVKLASRINQSAEFVQIWCRSQTGRAQSVILNGWNALCQGYFSKDILFSIRGKSVRTRSAIRKESDTFHTPSSRNILINRKPFVET